MPEKNANIPRSTDIHTKKVYKKTSGGSHSFSYARENTATVSERTTEKTTIKGKYIQANLFVLSLSKTFPNIIYIHFANLSISTL
jgi:hypothetical protein